MENIRTEQFLGNNKVIVGNPYTDLVLETLGKIYIKTGNKSKLLDSVLKTIDNTTIDKDNIIIVDNNSQLEKLLYPGDGKFIFNKLTGTLYITCDGAIIPLIESKDYNSSEYVRRSGDSMTGQLEITTISPPLIVSSSKLVNNFNAEFINGLSSEALAKKRENELISGNWTFGGTGVSNSKWTFNDNINVNKDLISRGSIGTESFASGFGGYGWRLDGNTNTLTIDYLIVRKALKVFELVINKISATNGSLWVSNSSTCSKTINPIIVTLSQLDSIGTWTGTEDNINTLSSIVPNNSYILFIDDNIQLNRINNDYNNGKNIGLVKLSSELSSSSEVNIYAKTFVNYEFLIYIADVKKLCNNSLFKNQYSLYDKELITSKNNIYGVSEDIFTEFHSLISLYYINKTSKAIEWDENNEVLAIEYVDSFNKETPFYIIPKDSIESFKKSGKPIKVFPYYKYFGIESSDSLVDLESNILSSIYIVSLKEGEYSTLKPGDIVRCQKYYEGNIKYYDAIVCSYINSTTLIVQKSKSIFDIYTELEYDKDGSLIDYTEKYNNIQYNKTEQYFNVKTGSYEKISDSVDRLGDITEGDDLVQIGNLQDINRQNSIYITSTDDQGPYIDILNNINRPDFSVLYTVPVYKKKTIVNSSKTSRQDYYIQTESTNDAVILETDSENTPILYGTLLPTDKSLIEKDSSGYKCTHTKTTKVRLGKLDGIRNDSFGVNQPYGFGLYGENVFLTGEFYLNNGTSVVDFSEENLLLKFKNAGLTISKVQKEENGIPVVDDNGNPVYEQAQKIDLDGTLQYDSEGNPIMVDKTQIILTADYIRFNTTTNSKAVEIITSAEDGTARINVEGDIQAHGLKIRNPNIDTSTDPDANVVCEITTEGKLIAKNGEFTGTVNASLGYIGEWKIDKWLQTSNYTAPTIKEYTDSPDGLNTASYRIVEKMGTGSILSGDGFVIQRNSDYLSYYGSPFAGLIAVEGSIGSIDGLFISVKQTNRYNPFSYITALELSAETEYPTTETSAPFMKPVALRIRKGFADIPGVLLAGRVIDGESTISVDYYYGQYRSFGGGFREFTISVSGSDALRNIAYTVNHNLGHTNYTVFVTPYRPGYTWNKVTPIIDYLGPDQFTVVFIDTGTGNNRRESSFCFTVIGNNYN